MQIHFWRHATLVLTIHDLKILVDPMLSPKGAIDPIRNSGNDIRNPMVELPISADELRQAVSSLDAVLITHTHGDHWDPVAQEVLPKDLTLLCQPEDEALLQKQGFTQVVPIPDHLSWRGLEIDRTGGEHGRGELAKAMAPVSGFVLQATGEPSLYIAGDTIWCPVVEQSLQRYNPELVVLNAGAATFATGGGPITMDENDVCQVARSAPAARIVAVHMESINHCRLTRAVLRTALETNGLQSQVAIPQDGEMLTFTA